MQLAYNSDLKHNFTYPNVPWYALAISTTTSSAPSFVYLYNHYFSNVFLPLPLASPIYIYLYIYITIQAWFCGRGLSTGTAKMRGTCNDVEVGKNSKEGRGDKLYFCGRIELIEQPSEK